jgi:hypothetical protein
MLETLIVIAAVYGLWKLNEWYWFSERQTDEEKSEEKREMSIW